MKHCSEVILVEGLFNLAVLWQAGFRNTTCAMGSHLNGRGRLATQLVVPQHGPSRVVKA